MYLFFKGAPNPPAIIYLSLEGDSLRSSWDYVRIPTVDVTLYLSLSFFGPSQLYNTTTTLLNTNTYNYTLQGVRSCDPFKLCIRAENEVGNSSWSCINDTLPYLPTNETIEYFLVPDNGGFTLNVIAMVRCVRLLILLFKMMLHIQILNECQFAVNSYFLKVTNADGNTVAVSPCVECGNSINLLVKNLNFSSFYNFTIKSNNSIGEQLTTAASFCKQ